MSEPVKVGDLVQCVRSCCDKTKCLGLIFTIAAIRNSATCCSMCGRENGGLHAGEVSNFIAGIPPSWLKRIPPLDELEGEKQKEDLREPA